MTSCYGSAHMGRPLGSCFLVSVVVLERQIIWDSWMVLFNLFNPSIFLFLSQYKRASTEEPCLYQVLPDHLWFVFLPTSWASHVTQWVATCQCRRHRRCGFDPWSSLLGRSPGEGHDDPLQYCCLKNPIDRGDWWAAVRGLQSQTWLSDWAHHAFSGLLPRRHCPAVGSGGPTLIPPLLPSFSPRFLLLLCHLLYFLFYSQL